MIVVQQKWMQSFWSSIKDHQFCAKKAEICTVPSPRIQGCSFVLLQASLTLMHKISIRHPFSYIELRAVMQSSRSAFLVLFVFVIFQAAAACSDGQCELGDRCSSSDDCGTGLYCYNCWVEFAGKKCVRRTVTDTFKIVDTSLPFNKYAFLTTHNSFSILGEPSHTGVPRITLYNQEDSVTDQLNNGVRALMLDVYDFRDEIWLCHSKGGKCFDFTAFEPAIDTMREIEAFLSSHPSEIVTLILEDYVSSDHGLSKLFNSTGLAKYWFPVTSMPRDGADWPRVGYMIERNHRLLVFTSDESKESSEGIAYQWNFMVENQCKRHSPEMVISQDEDDHV